MRYNIGTGDSLSIDITTRSRPENRVFDLTDAEVLTSAVKNRSTVSGTATKVDAAAGVANIFYSAGSLADGDHKVTLVVVSGAERQTVFEATVRVG